MDTEYLATQMSDIIPHQMSTSAQSVYPLPGLKLVKYHRPTAFEATLYKPIIGLIVQGRKETTLGGQTWGSGAGEMLVISHDLPVVARITEAPYMAVLLTLEASLLRREYARKFRVPPSKDLRDESIQRAGRGEDVPYVPV